MGWKAGSVNIATYLCRSYAMDAITCFPCDPNTYQFEKCFHEMFIMNYLKYSTMVDQQIFFFLKQTRCKRGFTIKIIVPLHETKNERNNSEFNLYHAWQWAVLSDPRSPFKDDICFFKCLFKVTRDENSIEQMPQVS